MPTFRESIAAAQSNAIVLRHDLHAHPELGYKEHRTSAAVTTWLRSCGIEFKDDLAGGTGVLGWLPATVDPDNARTVALRADMDALPIVEKTGLDYKSTNEGVMHACGHDGHTTILMTTAKVLGQASERRNNVLFVFQPAEEGGAGAQKLCQEGALKGQIIGKPVDIIFGLHGFPGGQVGHVTTRNGPLLAAASQFVIRIKGKGTHAAYPHKGVDPIVVASHIVTTLQSIVARNVDPLDSIVITIGKIVAGVAHNVIPDSAELHGTLRALIEETNAMSKRRIGEVAVHVAEALGATAEIEWVGAYPITFNDPVATDEFRRVAKQTLGEALFSEFQYPSMGGEDFSFYGHEVPASFFFLGLCPEGQETYPNLHSPEFDFNDDAIPTGVELMCELAMSR